MDNTLNKTEMPVLAMRGVLIFPNMTLSFDVGRAKSMAALKAATAGDRLIFLVAQKDAATEDPDFDDLNKIGVVAEIKQLIKLPNSDNMRVAIQGKCRAALLSPIKTAPFLKAEVIPFFEKKIKKADELYAEALTRSLKDIFNDKVKYYNYLNFILEGGAIESDGEGTMLTTSKCLLAPNRNEPLTKNEIDEFLKEIFGLQQILWLNHGYLSGDDTDNHIDTLARLCNETTIAYVQCTDEKDEHYQELDKMEKELAAFRRLDGEPYNLIPLPMAEPVYEDDYRLPATYANFLIMNNVVLMPTYDTHKDSIAKEQLQKAFPNREIIGIDCRTLIKQHGSLHCITMQYPEGFL